MVHIVTIELTLYSRRGCHLCEDMFEALKDYSNELGFTVIQVDIDQDEALRDRYNTRVPVLTLGENEICHYYLDKVALCTALEVSAT